MPRELVIDGHVINDQNPPFIVAEIGHNHAGSLAKAKQLVNAAKASGASAVKFQTRRPKDVYQANAKRGAYSFESDNPQWMDRVYGVHREKLEFSEREWGEVFEWCRKAGITALSTPFDFRSADMLADLGVPAFKIASGDATNIPLIKHVAGKGKPVIVSTGGCSMSDVLRVRSALGGAHHAILQCSCIYPAPDDLMNLRVIETYRDVFPDAVIGLSTHNASWHTSLAAYVLGARIVEHHFTVDRAWKGTDNPFSLTPETMAELVRACKAVRKGMGSDQKACDPREAEPTKERRKSLVWARQVVEWGTITREDIKILCPGDGIAPYYLDSLIGRRVAHTTGVDELVAWADIMVLNNETQEFEKATANA